MGALDLVIDCLADIVQKTRALRHAHVYADFRRQYAGQFRDLNRMPQRVLPVARAVTHASDELHKLRMNAVYADFEHRSLARFTHAGIDLALRLLNHLFDARGVNAAVVNQLLKRNLRDFTAHRVKAREHDRFRRVVDYQFHTGQLLKGADVSALAADDTSLHLVVRQLYHRDRGFRDAVCGATLNCAHHILLRLLICLFLCGALKVADHTRLVVLHIVLDRTKQEFLRLLHRESGNALQLFHPSVVERIHLTASRRNALLFLLQGLLSLFKRILLLVEILLLAEDTILIVLQLRATLLGFPLQFILGPERFFLGFQHGLALLCLRSFQGFFDDLAGFHLRAADLAFISTLPICNRKIPAQKSHNHRRNDNCNDDL